MPKGRYTTLYFLNLPGRSSFDLLANIFALVARFWLVLVVGIGVFVTTSVSKARQCQALFVPTVNSVSTSQINSNGNPKLNSKQAVVRDFTQKFIPLIENRKRFVERVSYSYPVTLDRNQIDFLNFQFLHPDLLGRIFEITQRIQSEAGFRLSEKELETLIRFREVSTAFKIFNSIFAETNQSAPYVLDLIQSLDAFVALAQKEFDLLITQPERTASKRLVAAARKSAEQIKSINPDFYISRFSPFKKKQVLEQLVKIVNEVAGRVSETSATVVDLTQLRTRLAQLVIYFQALHYTEQTLSLEPRDLVDFFKGSKTVSERDPRLVKELKGLMNLIDQILNQEASGLSEVQRQEWQRFGWPNALDRRIFDVLLVHGLITDDF